MRSLAALALLGCLCGASPGAAQVTRPPADEVALVKAHLRAAQAASFQRSREYCGYLVRLRNGGLQVTRLRRGNRNGCTPLAPPPGSQALASIHTHGAYHPSVPAEFPTTLDMESDAREGVNGYVATPGGRLWYIDSARQETVQLCGLGCLPQDPSFRAGDDGVIRKHYHYRDLWRIETQG